MGELRWNGESTGPLIVYDFKTQTEKQIRVELTTPKAKTSGISLLNFYNSILVEKLYTLKHWSGIFLNFFVKYYGRVILCFSPLNFRTWWC